MPKEKASGAGHYMRRPPINSEIGISTYFASVSLSCAALVADIRSVIRRHEH